MLISSLIRVCGLGFRVKGLGFNKGVYIGFRKKGFGLFAVGLDAERFCGV